MIETVNSGDALGQLEFAARTAADYIVAAVGVDGARVAAVALSAGWMTDAERDKLEPLAEAIRYMIGDEANHAN